MGYLPLSKRTFIALAIVFTVASVFLFNSFYKEAKNSEITKLNEEQAIHAKQAARGIEDFFSTWTRNLTSLAKMDAVIDNDAVGKRYIKLFYVTNQEHIRAITRLDERGVILYNLPLSSSAGTDISDQKHVRELLRNHKAVISDVFKTVEGFESVALHVPIFSGSVFKGSIGILINFESLAKRYLDVIKIGKTGYAWVVSRDGTVIYSPVPGTTGTSVFANIKDYPLLVVMVNDMLKGHEGAATYSFDKIGDRNVGQTRKYAVYMPAQIGNTFWSIVVASAEQDVLSSLTSFRNKLVLVIGVLFICGVTFSTLGTKAWFIVKEEEKRKQAEKALRESEAALRDSQNDLQMLAGRLISAQEEELRRLSRELHDDLTQRLAGLAIDAGILEKQLMTINDQATQELRRMKIKLIDVSDDVHKLSRQLHPSILDDMGLVEAVKSESAIFSKRTGIALSFEHQNMPDSIPYDIALCLYRVIQEGLRNIEKHAETREAGISLQGLSDGIRLLIQDPGIGFDNIVVRNKAGLGLSSMRERVRLTNGTMSLKSEPAKGTEVEIFIPVGGKHDQVAHFNS